MTIDDTIFEDSMRRVMHIEMPEMIRDAIRADVPDMVRDAIQAEVPDMIRGVIQTEAPDMIRSAIQDEVPDMVRGIVRAENADMRQDIIEIKDIVGSQSMRLNHMRTQVGQLIDTVRYQAAETHRLDILLEDLNDRFATARELRWD